jgi:hypothetical protein
VEFYQPLISSYRTLAVIGSLKGEPVCQIFGGSFISDYRLSAWKRHLLEIDLTAGQAVALVKSRLKESKPDG